MIVTAEDLSRLDSVIQEAHVLGLRFDGVSQVAITFDVWTYDERNRWPSDSRRLFVLSPVGRIAASLRAGRWDDTTAAVQSLSIHELSDTVESFHAQAIYGGKFFNRHNEELARWGDRLSLDFQRGPDGHSHSICLFQEDDNRHLDCCIWFDDLEILDPSGRPLTVDEVVAGMLRWDAAVKRRDPAAMVKRDLEGNPYSWMSPLENPQDLKRAKRVIDRFVSRRGVLPDGPLSRIGRALRRIGRRQAERGRR